MKKHLLRTGLLVLLMLAMCATALAASYYVSGTESLKLRSKPNDGASVLGSFRRDYAVTSLKKFDKNWSYVKLSTGKEGYVRTKYLKSSKSYTAYVKADDTGLFSGPLSTYTKLSTLSKGTKVKVLTAGRSYSYVHTSSGYGYIRKGALSKKVVKASPKFKPYQAYLVSPSGGKVNVRRRAGTGYAAVTSAPSGTPVTVEEVISNWSKVTVNGITGYVKNTYLSKKKPAAAAADATAAAVKKHTAYIKSANGKKVNVRRGPGTGYAGKAQLEPGTKVTVLEDTDSKNWSHIAYNGTTGYVQKTYLSRTAPKKAADGTVVVKTKTKTVKSPDNKAVNIRRGPGLGYASVGKVEIGTKVTVLGTEGKWSRVQYGNIKGYIKNVYLK